MGICLAFYPISETYRKKLQTFSDSILAQGITENRPPLIEFTGVNSATLNGIINIYLNYDHYGA